MAIKKNVNFLDVLILLFFQGIFSIILTLINAGIVGWSSWANDNPTVITWYYMCAAFLMLVIFVLIILALACLEEEEGS